MQSDSILYGQSLTQSNLAMHDSEPISPLRASVDPRFSSLLIRAATYRERASQQRFSAASPVHSPSIVTSTSNAWAPKDIANEKPVDTQKKTCLSPVCKNRLQGLFIGLGIAAISIGIILAVLLATKTSSTDSSTPTTTVAPACSSLQWNSISASATGNSTYGNGSSQFMWSMGIYVDSNKAIYVADYYNHRVQKWEPNATSGTTVAGTTGISGSSNSLLSNPTVVYVDSQQNLYIADNNGIIIWPLGASAGSRISGSNSFGSTYGMHVDKNGNIYCTYSWSCSVRMWTTTATASTLVAGGNGCGMSPSQLYYPYGLTVDLSTNTIYIANSNAHTIVAWPIGATVGTIVAGVNSTYGTGDNFLNFPYDVKRDQFGNLYVSDANNNRVVLFCRNPPTTIARTIAGHQLSSLRTIALDSDLNLYAFNQNFYQVRKFTRII